MIVKSEPLTKEQVLENVYLRLAKIDRIEFQVNQFKKLNKLSVAELSTRIGLCCSVFGAIQIETMYLIFELWPHFSGSKYYPVPSTQTEMTAMEAYDCAFYEDAMLDGEYGQLRIDLYEFTFAALKTIAEIYDEKHKQNNASN